MTTEGTTPPVETKFTQKDIEAERAHAQHFKSQLDEAQAKLKGLGDIDTLIAKAKRADELAAKDAGADPEKIKVIVAEKEKEIDSRYASKLTETEQRAAQAEAKLRRHEVVSPAMIKAADVFNAGNLEIIQGMVERDLDLVDGKVVVKGPDGKPLISSDPRNGLMPVAEYLEGLAKKFPDLAKATANAGALDPRQKQSAASQSGKTYTAADFARMTPAEQNKAIDEGGEAAARAFLSTVRL